MSLAEMLADIEAKANRPPVSVSANTLPITRVCETCYERYTTSLAVARQVTIPICAACLEAEQADYALMHTLDRYYSGELDQEIDG